MLKKRKESKRGRAIGNGLDVERKEIEELGLNAIKEYFQISIERLTQIDPKILDHIHKKARLGMSFEKELNLSRRAIELNYIRVFRLIADDKKELKELFKKSLPNYYSG